MTRRSTALLVLALLFAGCPARGPALEVFCGQYVDAVCARLAECNGATAAAWCTLVGRDQLCREVSATERGGTTRYQPEYSQACLDIVAALPCQVLTPGGSGELDVLCSEALNGLVPAGGACTADRECERDFHCDRSASRCPGVCRRLRESGEGCDELGGVQCAAGLVCLAGVCGVPLAADAGCADSRHCQSGLFCDSFQSPSTCAPVRSSGPCRQGEADCAPRAACTSAGTCAVARQAGESCVVGQRQCNLLLSCADGTCQSWGALGASCGEFPSGERADCLEGSCAVPPGQLQGSCTFKAAGAPCVSNAECGRGGQCLGTPRLCLSRCAPP